MRPSVVWYAVSVLRLDSFDMGEIQVTPQGGLRIPATFARPGVFPYRQPDGSIRREYRSPAAVADPAFLATIAGAPVTMGHPVTRLVNATTWRQLAVGHAAEAPVLLPDGMAGGAVYVMDEAAIKAIGAEGPLSPRQISPGLFVTEYDPTPGVTPEGEPYDGVQRVLRLNHVALVPRGRQGESVGLRLDSAGDEIPPDSQEPQTMKITIAGKQYEAGSAEAEKALADMQVRLDAADKLTAQVNRLARERLAHMRADLRRVKIEIRNDADEAALMAEALGKMIPGFSVDGQSPDYVMGAFAAGLAMLLADDEADDKAQKPGQPGAPAAAAPGAAPAAGGAEQVRNDAIDARKQTLGATKLTEIVPGAADVARAEMIKRGQNRTIRPE